MRGGGSCSPARRGRPELTAAKLPPDPSATTAAAPCVAAAQPSPPAALTLARDNSRRGWSTDAAIRVARMASSAAARVHGSATPEHNDGKQLLMHAVASARSEERDWAQLLPELVNKVADGLLLVDPTEYIRLRAVCKPWRRCTADPSLIETRFFPRNWLLLAERKLRQDGEPEHFVNVRTGASLRIHLPWPDEFTHHGNAEGLLVLYHEITDMVCLLNPLTMAITDLPSMAAVNAAARSLNLNTMFSENCIKAAGVIMVAGEAGRPRPNPTIMLSLTLLKQTLLVCAKPGEFSWTAINMSCTREVEGRLPMIEGGLSARGHFYIPTRAGDVLTVELQPQPHLRFVARQGGNLIRSGLNHSSYIVPSGDDKGSGMLLVRTRWRKHQLYSMDSTVELDNSRLIRHTMSGITVFLPSITLNSSQFPLVSQNDVYTEVSTRRLLQGEYI